MSAKTTKKPGSTKDAPANPNPAPDSDAASGASDPLAAIRELLYGEQVKLINTDIRLLTEQMNTRLQALRAQMEQSLERLHADFSGQLKDLDKHVESLNKARVQREGDLSADIDDVRHQLGRAIEESNSADDALRQQMDAEIKRLEKEMSDHHGEVMAELARTSKELSSNKADRKTLASLLAGMADNLTTDEPG